MFLRKTWVNDGEKKISKVEQKSSVTQNSGEWMTLQEHKKTSTALISPLRKMLTVCHINFLPSLRELIWQMDMIVFSTTVSQLTKWVERVRVCSKLSLTSAIIFPHYFHSFLYFFQYSNSWKHPSLQTTSDANHHRID